MKKNFLMVAALLIAAMLMVVSCTQEVAPVDNNLVEVTLNTSTARSALEYTGLGDRNNGAVTYRYKLTAQWKPEDITQADQVVGNTTNYVTFSGSNTTTQSLGYVSQGLWKVEVIGSIGSKDVLSGETQVYINKNNATVTVYVEPMETANSARIELDVNVNDHEASTGNKYKLVYSIEKVDGTPATGTVSEVNEEGKEVEVSKTLTSLDMEKGDLDVKGFRKWSKIVTNMTPGYYRVTVTMMNDTNKVGGITQGVLLFANDTSAKLSGYVNSSDFINGTLNVYYPSVKVGINEPTVTKVNHSFAEGESEVPSYEVTYKATSTITGDNSVAGGETYTWYADGVKVKNENANDTYTAYYKETEPGYKTVTCVVKYTFSITDDAGNKVDYVVQGSKDLTTKVYSSPVNATQD